MHLTSTPPSLLEQLHDTANQEAWKRFVRLYIPLLYHWGRRLHLQDQDAADLIQDVLVTLVHKMPGFTYDRNKTFRGWLRTITVNKWREKCRRATLPREADAALDDVPVPDAAEAFWETEYQQHLVGRALRLMQAEFQPATWRACWEVVVADRPAAEVAAELNISLGAVYAAKSRVLRRLRQELADLVD